ncbi:DHI2 dehydrogenase, partial [Polyodon spathula]|nr:DHI2 dehydrogenase [Polyodon spathula]
MEQSALSFWMHLGVMSVFFGVTVKRILASGRSSAPALLVYFALFLLMERLCSFCLPTYVGLGVFCAACWLIMGTVAAVKPLPVEGKAVFITGCDSGFGKAAALFLDSLGFQVFASVLDLEGAGAQELQKTCSARLTLICMDITKPEQVQEALRITKAKLGVKGLWGLVNNAGVCVNFGDAELSLMSNYRGCMEVNFFGTLEVTKTFLPLLRQSQGRLVTISSPSGEQPFPCLAAYGASKAALNLFFNTLRHELKLWDVKVSIILPSSYKTEVKLCSLQAQSQFTRGSSSPTIQPAQGICQSINVKYWEEQYKHLIENLSLSLMEEYGEEYLLETKQLFFQFAETATEDLSPVTNSIAEALLSREPKVRYYAGQGVGLMYFIHCYLPVSISDRFLQRLFMKKSVLPRALQKHNNNNKKN